jgi:small subunit ribosomal protein S6
MPNRRYETLILIHPEQGDAGTKELVTRIRQLAESQGAVISGLHDWGMRELAYPVGRQRRAHHVLVEFRATPQALHEIERNLKLLEPVLRHLSVRRAENAPAVPVRPTPGAEPARGMGGADESPGDDDGDTGLNQEGGA